jgi:hypothetical protein
MSVNLIQQRPKGTGLPADHPKVSQEALAKEKRNGKFKRIGVNDLENKKARKRYANKKAREKKAALQTDDVKKKGVGKVK